jgi:hypothetical protein
LHWHRIGLVARPVALGVCVGSLFFCLFNPALVTAALRRRRAADCLSCWNVDILQFFQQNSPIAAAWTLCNNLTQDVLNDATYDDAYVHHLFQS